MRAQQKSSQTPGPCRGPRKNPEQEPGNLPLCLCSATCSLPILGQVTPHALWNTLEQLTLSSGEPRVRSLFLRRGWAAPPQGTPALWLGSCPLGSAAVDFRIKVGFGSGSPVQEEHVLGKGVEAYWERWGDFWRQPRSLLQGRGGAFVNHFLGPWTTILRNRDFAQKASCTV